MTDRRALLLCLIALIAVGVLTVLPQSRWLVREEMQFVSGNSDFPPAADISPFLCFGNGATTTKIPLHDPAESAIVRSHVSDFPVLLAYALKYAPPKPDSVPAAAGTMRLDSSKPRNPSVQALLRLRTRFGNRADLSAHILRYLCQSDLTIARDEGRLLIGPRRLQEMSHLGNTEGPASQKLRIPSACLAIAQTAT